MDDLPRREPKERQTPPHLETTRKLPKLVKPTDYFALLRVQVGSDEIAQKSL